MYRALPCLALIAAAAPAPDPQLEALRAIDLRLATIGDRLVRGNAALCRDHAPAMGMIVQALAQYPPEQRAAARATFGFPAPVAVEAVVAGGAAARAGVRADDGLVAVNGVAVAAADPGAAPASSDARDAAASLIARQPAGAPLRLTVMRGGARREIAVDAPQGCRAAFEAVVERGMPAHSDGGLVQVGVRFFERYDDDATAAVVAHEFAHIVLAHRARLEAAGVKGGMFGELGRSGRLTRVAEEQADRLSVHLLRNAGYDPRVAVRFWHEHGGDVDGGVFRSRTHPSSSARAAAIEAEILAIPAGAGVPYVPALLATRDAPLG